MTITRLHLRTKGIERPEDLQLCGALFGLPALDPVVEWTEDALAVVTIWSWSKPAIVFIERTLHHMGPFRLGTGLVELIRMEIIPRSELQCPLTWATEAGEKAQ